MTVHALSDRPQTNVQLYCSLLELGRTRDDLLEVRDAYRLASRIFAGQIRPEGRPFTCHLVGVAGILSMLGESTPVICAGLLHSALSHGDFGAGSGRANGDARRTLARSVGQRTFDLVDRYSRLNWNARTLREWTVAGSTQDGTPRELIMIRLANELDDALDRAAYLSEKGGLHRHLIPRELVVAVARLVCAERMAVALEGALLTNIRTEELSFLREDWIGSGVEAPLSYRRRRLRPIVLALKDSAHKAARHALRFISGDLR